MRLRYVVAWPLPQEDVTERPRITMFTGELLDRALFRPNLSSGAYVFS